MERRDAAVPRVSRARAGGARRQARRSSYVAGEGAPAAAARCRRDRAAGRGAASTSGRSCAQLAGLEIAPSVRDVVADARGASSRRGWPRCKAEYEAKLTRAARRTLSARRSRAGWPKELLRSARRLGGDAGASLLQPPGTLPATAGSGAGAATGGRAEPPPAAPDATGGRDRGTATAAAAAAAPAAPAPPRPSAEAEDDLAIEAVHRLGALHHVQRVHQPQQEDVRLQRGQAGVRQGRRAPARSSSSSSRRRRCPVGIIHPGTPLNPKEKDLDEVDEAREAFN